MSLEFRQYLQDELARRCQKNPGYSLRAFARSLKMDPTTLGRILKGQRPLGKLVTQRLGTRLGLDPVQVSQFLPSAQAGAVLRYEPLKLDQFRMIADWYHYALLELLRVDGAPADPRGIAKALGITPAEAHIALERLERMGLIRKSESGQWQEAGDGKLTTVGGPDTAPAFRQLQRQILEKAILALEATPPAERDQSSMTIAIDSELLPLAKEKIKKFRRELAQLLSRGRKRDSVYHLSVSLYPVTRKTHEKRKKP